VDIAEEAKSWVLCSSIKLMCTVLKIVYIMSQKNKCQRMSARQTLTSGWSGATP
jgi:hypothetical protein